MKAPSPLASLIPGISPAVDSEPGVWDPASSKVPELCVAQGALDGYLSVCLVLNQKGSAEPLVTSTSLGLRHR